MSREYVWFNLERRTCLYTSDTHVPLIKTHHTIVAPKISWPRLEEFIDSIQAIFLHSFLSSLTLHCTWEPSFIRRSTSPLSHTLLPLICLFHKIANVKQYKLDTPHVAGVSSQLERIRNDFTFISWLSSVDETQNRVDCPYPTPEMLFTRNACDVFTSGQGISSKRSTVSVNI